MSSPNGDHPGKTFAMLRQVSESALPRAQKAVLTTLLIYARPTDLTVYHGQDQLAWACGYTMPTIHTAIYALLARGILRIQKNHHPDHATEYQIDLTPLPTRPAYRPPSPARQKPGQTQNDLAFEPESPAPQTENSFGFETESSLAFDPGQTQNSFASIETISIETKEEAIFLGNPEPAPMTPKKNGEGRSRTQAKTKTKTPAPDTLDLTDELRAWVRAKQLQVDVVFEREKFLQHCRAHAIENVDWTEAFKGWLLEAHRRATHNSHRPGPDPVVAALRARPSAERPMDPASDPLPRPTPAAEAAPPRPPARCDWAYGCAQAPCPHGSRCASHAGCAACFAAQRAVTTHTGTPHPLGSDTGPPPEASAFYQRQVVQEATAHGFTGLGKLVAAVAPNGNGYDHASEDPP